MGKGQIIGAVGGLFIGGPVGALIGFCVGHLFEKVMDGQPLQLFSSESDTTQYSFQISLLTLMAAVMKANGQTKRVELDYVKGYIRKAFLSSEDQHKALQLLKEMLNHDINVVDVATQISENINIFHKRQLISFLIGIGMADGCLEESEDAIIKQIAYILGFSPIDYEAIKTGETVKRKWQYGADNNNQQGGAYSNSNSGSSSKSTTDSDNGTISEQQAYNILGVTKDATNEEVKKAYNKELMANHPDKYASLGEKVCKEQEEKVKIIIEAYRIIKRKRGIA